jgi:hypothetical protein
MVAWRTLGSLVVALAVTGSVRAQTYKLQEAPLPGSYFDVHLAMDLNGEMRVQKTDKEKPVQVTIKQTATARHEYFERVLDAADGGPAVRTARVYRVAQAAITVGENRSDRTLRPDSRTLIVAHRIGDQLVTFNPRENGQLTREELELTQHFDTLAVTGLLPRKEVRTDETWPVPNAIVQALCHLDGLTSHDLECRLEQVKDNVALISVKGTANGIDTGASVKALVRASCEFDVKAQRLTSVKWKESDERDQGPASPALTFTMTVTLTRSQTEAVEELNDIHMVPVPFGPPTESMTALSYTDPQSRFAMVYTRDWQLVAHTNNFVVLRLLDRGDFVAQATITPLQQAAAGKYLTDDEFKELVNATPGWVAEAEAKVEEITASNGYTIRRLATQGQLDGLKATQYCYLVASPQGEQAVVAFTMTPAQVQTLNTRDLALVRGLTFTSGR